MARKSLAGILKATRKKINVLNAEVKRLDDLKRENEKLEEITEIIEGLRRTKEESKQKRYYEGKYSPSYRYAERIDGEDIVATEDFKPGMMHKCPECGAETPVLRYYYQEYDSPEGDTWVTKALAICCDKVYEIKKIVDRN